jgi:hypothetical protein
MRHGQQKKPEAQLVALIFCARHRVKENSFFSLWGAGSWNAELRAEAEVLIKARDPLSVQTPSARNNPDFNQGM